MADSNDKGFGMLCSKFRDKSREFATENENDFKAALVLGGRTDTFI